MHYVYVLKSLRIKKLYVGRSDDLKRRMKEHRAGGVWTTKKMMPLQLIFYEAFSAKNDAIRRERYFKTNKGKTSLRQIIRESLK